MSPILRRLLIYVLLVSINRRRLNARIVELEDLAETAKSRASKLEKEKSKLIIEIREITVELETVSMRVTTGSLQIIRLINTLSKKNSF